MNIAVITPQDPIPIYCGSLRHFFEMANTLGQWNVVNVYFPCHPEDEVIGETPKQLNFRRIPIKSVINNLLYPLIPGFSSLKGLYNFQPWLYFPLKRLFENSVPDVISVHSLFLFPMAFRLSKKLDVPIVLTEHDVNYLAYEKMGYRTVPLLKTLEVYAIRKATAVVAMTEKDKKELSRYTDPNKIFVIPDGVDVDNHRGTSTFRIRVREKYSIDGLLLIFHGYLSYPPNEEAVEIIEKKLIDKIIAREPKTKVMIIGKNPPKTNHPNIITTGFVNNLPEYVSAADVAIVPLVSGGGIKGKILEYLSCEIPIVTTEKGAEGMGLTHRKEALISRDVDDDFVDLACELLSDRTLQNKLKRNGRKFVEENYQWKKLMLRYYSIFEKCISKKQVSKKKDTNNP